MSEPSKSQPSDACRYEFSVEGMKCRSCSSTIERALKTLHEITSVQCDPVTKQLIVVADSRYHPSIIRQKVILKLDEIGFQCQEVQLSKPPKKNLWQRWLLGALGTVSGLLLMSLSLMGVSFGLPVLIAIASISTLFTVYLGWEFYSNAFKVFTKSRELNMNTLFAISTLTVLAVSISAFFFPWLPMIFDAGLMIFGFRHLGLAIEESLKQAVISELSIKDYSPRTVRVVEQDEARLKLLADVRLGDIIEIKAGEVIPVDGLALSDEASVYDTIDSGARLPRLLRKEEQLLAGMFLAADSKPLRMKVTTLASDSYLARFDEQLQEAKKKQPLQTIAKTILQYFIPSVLLLSALSLIIISCFFPVTLAIQCAIAVLVSACPCTLGMIIPLAVKIGMNKASKQGVEYKSTKIIEEIGELADKVDTVVFDLHGTLTEGKPKVLSVDIRPESGLTEEEFLAYLALLEKKSPHPVAHAIRTYIASKNIVPDKTLTVSNLRHENPGIMATINGSDFILGSNSLLASKNIRTNVIHPELNVGDSLVYLAKDGKIIGQVHLADPLRKDARFVVDYLKQQGKQICLCTGADESTAKRYAKELGISEDNVSAGLRGSRSEDKNLKMSFIRSLKKQGHCVAMVGDGPNDAPAIAASDVGIALNTGDDIGHRVAQEQAGAVIENGSLKGVLVALTVAKQTVNHIKQNLLMSFGYNLTTMLIAGGLLLAFGFMINPAVGAALMIVQSSLILLNTYRIKEQSLSFMNVTHPEPAPSFDDSYGSMTKLGLSPSLSKDDIETRPAHVTSPRSSQPSHDDANIPSQTPVVGYS
ncbi:heavy metal translocating P-type ATPase [Legionella yabuuchiae]|uniref:heavy metal translocating P-type ATPase n=1 Tax=Legionella yabuuchiae TaxID=376727 RepID=UPI00105630F0|nr:cation-translocating P-type ATPase [Legionella yabuuchiae]